MKPTKISTVPKVVIMFFSNCIYLSKKKNNVFQQLYTSMSKQGQETDQIYGIEVIFLPMELLRIHGKETLFNKHMVLTLFPILRWFSVSL